MAAQIVVPRRLLLRVAGSVICLSVVLGGGPPVSSAAADNFGSGANTFEIEFVAIGNSGNAPDHTGQPDPAGSVPYTYRIGKYEISEQMIDTANTLGVLGITKDTRGPNKPATSVDWFEVAKFVNWLNTSTGGTPAYKFDANGEFQLWEPGDAGYNPANLFRNTQARYFLPSADEWYKAAFYDPAAGVYYDYPTGSNIAPTAVASGTAPGTAVYRQSFAAPPADITLAGGLSPYGTMGQGGNVWEWEESEYDLANNSTSSNRGARGGAWDSIPILLQARHRPADGNPTLQSVSLGVRVASVVPEPSTAALLIAALVNVFGLRTRRWIEPLVAAGLKHISRWPCR